MIEFGISNNSWDYCASLCQGRRTPVFGRRMGLAVAPLISVVAMAASPAGFLARVRKNVRKKRSEQRSEQRSQERSQASNRMDEAIDQARDARVARDRAQDTVQDNS
jgi:hypothetical protein